MKTPDDTPIFTLPQLQGAIKRARQVALREAWACCDAVAARMDDRADYDEYRKVAGECAADIQCLLDGRESIHGTISEVAK